MLAEARRHQVAVEGVVDWCMHAYRNPRQQIPQSNLHHKLGALEEVLQLKLLQKDATLR